MFVGSCGHNKALDLRPYMLAYLALLFQGKLALSSNNNNLMTYFEKALKNACKKTDYNCKIVVQKCIGDTQ
jgi:hypothetical protein